MDDTKGDEYIVAGAVEKLEYALHLQKINQELAEHLNDSLLWVLHYCKKHNIPLPDMDKIRKMIDYTIELEQKMSPDQPKGNTNKNNPRGNRACFMELSNLRLFF